MQERRNSTSFTDHLFVLAQAPWLRWSLVIALIALYAGWTGYVVSREKGYDFYAYYIGAYGFSKGINVYEVIQEGRAWWEQTATQLQVPELHGWPYRYPPLTATLVAPLLPLGPINAYAVWTIGSALVFLASAWLIDAALPRRSIVPFLTLALSLPVLTTLYAGQVNALWLLGFALAFYGMMKNRPFVTGFGIAFGILIKLTPAILIPYLAWHRRWKAIVATCLFLALISLLCLPVVDLDSTLSAPAYILGQLGGPSSDVPNQSLGALVRRLFTSGPSPAVIPAPTLWRPLCSILQLTIVGLSIALFWRQGSASDRIPLEFSYVMLLSLILPSLVWYHYLALAILPICVLAYRYEQTKDVPGLVVLVIGLVLTSLHGAIWKLVQSIPVINSMPALYSLLVLLLLTLEIRRQRQTPLRAENPMKHPG